VDVGSALVGGSHVGVHSDFHSDEAGDDRGEATNEESNGSVELTLFNLSNSGHEGTEDHEEDTQEDVFLLKECNRTLYNIKLKPS